MGHCSPIDVLRREHDNALSGMKQLLSDLEGRRSGSSAPALHHELAPRLQSLDQTLLLHFRKEEEGLYPDVRCIVAEGAPAVDILGQFFGEAADDDLTAHHILRRHLRDLRQELAAVGQATGSSPPSLDKLHALLSIAFDILTRHAKKENTVIFPMIARLLDESQMSAAGERIRAITRAGF